MKPLAAPARRKFRAGDDVEAADSGESQANAAAETPGAAGSGAGDVSSADASVLAAAPDSVPSDGHPVPVAADAGSLSASTLSADSSCGAVAS